MSKKSANERSEYKQETEQGKQERVSASKRDYLQESEYMRVVMSGKSNKQKIESESESEQA